MSDTNSNDIEGGMPIGNEGAPTNDQAANNNEPEQREAEQKQADDPEWFKRRIDRFTKQRAAVERDRDEARSEAERARAELAALRAKYEPGNDNRQQGQPRTEDQIRNDERQQISARQSAEQFTERCNDVASKAASTYGEDGFRAANGNWLKAGLDLADTGHATLLRDLVSLPDAEHLYHHIGTDPDLAARLLDMNEKDAYAELRGIARSRPWTQTAQEQQEVAPPAQQQVSQAPRPAARQPGPARVSSRTIYDRDIPLSEFMDKRNKGL